MHHNDPSYLSHLDAARARHTCEDQGEDRHAGRTVAPGLRKHTAGLSRPRLQNLSSSWFQSETTGDEHPLLA